MMRKLKPSMEIEDEIDLHKTGWIAQRIGWAIILLIPVMGLLGLFGTGWLSESTVSENGYRLTYERFGRYEAPSTISLDINSTSATNSSSLFH